MDFVPREQILSRYNDKTNMIDHRKWSNARDRRNPPPADVPFGQFASLDQDVVTENPMTGIDAEREASRMCHSASLHLLTKTLLQRTQ